MANRLVAVDDNFNLPPEVQQQLAGNFEDEFQSLRNSAAASAVSATSSAAEAAGSASSAAASATTAQEAAETATAPTDAAVDAGIERAAAAGKILGAADLVGDMLSSTSPIIIGHRGGARIHPEHTLEGYRDCVRSGFYPEVDIYRLSTGELVCIHDTTTTRTMSGATATVASMTLADWQSRTVRSPWPGGNGAAPAMWEDVLNEFGGRTVIVAEIKDASAVNDIIESVLRRGLNRHVILQSFNLTIATQVAAAGIPALYLASTTTTTTPAQLTSAGIQFFGPALGMAASTIASFRSAGIKVVPYTVSTAAEWATLQTKNVDGAFFDDPWGATGKYPRKFRDPFTESQPWYGWTYYSSNTGSEPQVNYNNEQGSLMITGIPGPMGSSMRQSWAYPVTIDPTQCIRLRGKVGFDSGGSSGANASSTRWAGAFIGITPNGEAYKDLPEGSAGQYGYHFLMRRNGNLEIYKVEPSGPTNLATQTSSPPLAPVTSVLWTEFEIILHSSGMLLRRLDNGTTVSASGTVNLSSYRSNMELHLTNNGNNVLYRDLFFGSVSSESLGY